MIFLNWFREWILPHEGQVPDYKTLRTYSDPREMEFCRSEFILLHRHEDTIFNNRLQTFLLVSSFLAAGFSQFREEQYFFVQVFVCFCGAVVSLFSFWILIRTARVIEWYREALHRLDAALIPNENYQPFRTRCLRTVKREQRIEDANITVDTAEPPFSTPVSGVLGALPIFVCLVWFALLIWSVYAHLNRPLIGSDLLASPYGQIVTKVSGNSSLEPPHKQDAEPKPATPCVSDVPKSTPEKRIPSKSLHVKPKQ
jgi:hypothetical protein